jgi:hypothetical protein
MSLFTSNRERRLWFWTLAVLVAIYATLGLAGKLAGYLREYNLLGVAYGLGMLLAVGAVIAQWVKSRPGRREIWVTLGVVAVYFMAWVRIENPAERTHLFEYGLVAVFIYQALSERLRNGRRVPIPAGIAIIATALMGWLDEGIQAILPNRVYDLRDVGVNALAGLLAIAASLVLDWARSRRQKSVIGSLSDSGKL